MYYIWIKHYDYGELVGASVSAKGYKYKGNAIRAARKNLDKPRRDGCSYLWIVSETNPWANQNHANKTASIMRR